MAAGKWKYFRWKVVSAVKSMRYFFVVSRVCHLGSADLTDGKQGNEGEACSAKQTNWNFLQRQPIVSPIWPKAAGEVRVFAAPGEVFGMSGASTAMAILRTNPVSILSGRLQA